MKTKYPFFKTINHLFKQLFTDDKMLPLLMIIFTLAAITTPVATVIMPRFVINELMVNTINFENIIYIIGLFFIVVGISSFLEIFALNVAYPRITEIRINYLFKQCDDIMRMKYKYSEDPKFADEMNNALDAAGGEFGVQNILSILFRLASKVIIVIAYIVIISLMNPIVLLGIALSVLVSYGVSRLVKNYQYSKKDELARLSRKKSYYYNTSYDFSFGKDIRLYNLQDKILNNYRNEIYNYIGAFKKIVQKEYRLGFLELLASLISDSLIYTILVYKVLNGMSIADFSMYLAASLALTTAFKRLMNDINEMIYQGQFCYDLFTFMEKDFSNKQGGLKKIENDTLEIEFKNVSFKYPNTDNYIIKNLNLKINKGEKLAIVGINGAGKTTIVKLITRLFDIEEGEILVNGINIKEYDIEEYYKMFSVVFQDITTLAFTIRDNVAYGDKNPDDERIWDCLRRVGLKEKVASFELGLDQMMLKIIDENGTQFSGGENQKLAIARALYRNGNMVILDEPTAALDALAEASIYQSFNDLVASKTAIYISHRLASTKFCDKIALFSNNGLIEYGNHDELMNMQKEYYNMFITQGKYYQEEGEDHE